MIPISCSIVLFNNIPEEVKKTIESFLSCKMESKLYLVDNSPEDKLRYQFISPRIEYIFTGKNLGYGKGHNIAIQKSIGKSKYHLILNPDVVFTCKTLDGLYDFMESHETVGLAMPQVRYQNGELQYLCKKLPSPNDLLLRRFIPGPAKFIFRKMLQAYELRHLDYNRMMEVPNLSGCFMFIRTAVFSKIGIFDERYFLYLEDTDLSRRINEEYHTIYYPQACITHGYTRASYKSFKMTLHHLRSSLQYFNKWGWYNDKKRGKINQSFHFTAEHSMPKWMNTDFEINKFPLHEAS